MNTRTKLDRNQDSWRGIVCPLCVALAGLVAGLGLEYAVFRLPPRPVTDVPLFALYFLIVWGMVRGLAGPPPVACRSKGSNKGLKAPLLTVVCHDDICHDEKITGRALNREQTGLSVQLRDGRGRR